MKTPLIIVTRQSPLAVWQAEFVRQALLTHYPTIQIELLKISTRGDQILDRSLSKIGGKGLFLKELQEAVLSKRADLAVHSLKDMPVKEEPQLRLAAFGEREDPRDCMVSLAYSSFDALPHGASVGTSSLRRAAQLLNQRPDLVIKNLRGNVNTRLQKLEAQEYDAIILAAAGLKRLGMTDRITDYFSVDRLLPSIGQGILGIECRADDHALLTSLAVLNSSRSCICARAERALGAALGSSCQVPVGGYADLSEEGQLILTGLVATSEGQTVLKVTKEGDCSQPELLGQAIANALLEQGAGAILAGLRG